LCRRCLQKQQHAAPQVSASYETYWIKTKVDIYDETFDTRTSVDCLLTKET
jgi:hypothetical protein